MKTTPKHLSLKERTGYHRFEDVVGCKWSAAVLAAIALGVTRPGQLERFIPGISTKVLNERLRKLLAFGLIVREEFPGLPARVDYGLTPAGKKLAHILEQLGDLNDEHSSEPTSS
ncbi:MAG: helix-turn-helix transcriptional regulator [Akkermansiaceae bacterium]|nr:helix-turn-helix transcriptional regulator [Verrucomicrobiales bacterium]